MTEKKSKSPRDILKVCNRLAVTIETLSYSQYGMSSAPSKYPSSHFSLSSPGTILFPIPITAKNYEKKTISSERKMSIYLRLLMTDFIKVTSGVSAGIILMKKSDLMMEHIIMSIMIILRVMLNGFSIV